MDTITIKISELNKEVRQMLRNGMDYVQLSLCESSGVPGDILPACVSLVAYSKRDPHLGHGYNEIDAVSRSEFSPDEDADFTTVKTM